MIMKSRELTAIEGSIFSSALEPNNNWAGHPPFQSWVPSLHPWFLAEFQTLIPNQLRQNINKGLKYWLRWHILITQDQKLETLTNVTGRAPIAGFYHELVFTWCQWKYVMGLILWTLYYLIIKSLVKHKCLHVIFPSKDHRHPPSVSVCRCVYVDANVHVATFQNICCW